MGEWLQERRIAGQPRRCFAEKQCGEKDAEFALSLLFATSPESGCSVAEPSVAPDHVPPVTVKRCNVAAGQNQHGIPQLVI